ncbi:Chemotaxis protein methyltransferase CheR [Polaromonas sp. CG9_12]|nr:Chemotaxis protein methyltransferase CheR [Polaromonas sp. CG9_12]
MRYFSGLLAPNAVLLDIALTGYSQDTDRQFSREAGFDHHLAKPANFDVLENLLKAVSEKLT